MCIALIGGMDRLEREYCDEAAKLGIDLRVFTRSEARMASKIRNVDAMVIFTNKVSHQVKKQAMNMARAKDIPVVMHHSCGVCTLRECLSCLSTIKGGCLDEESSRSVFSGGGGHGVHCGNGICRPSTHHR